MTTTTDSAVQFFYEHAGYGYGPDETPEQGRHRGAVELAEAEAWAKAAGVEYTWQDDWEIGNHRDFYGEDSAYSDNEPTTCEVVSLTFEGQVLASLSCIDDATDEYRRVVEAQLAAEAHGELFSPKTTSRRTDDTELTAGALHSIRATVFSLFITLANGRVEHFRSDFYHDAIWLHENLTGPLVFFYGCDDSGTAIGIDGTLVRYSRKTVWRIDVATTEPGNWEITTTRLP